jgi:phosphopantothenoylcysteine decarboxylase/phosphopantothenate--cysteine ligase
LLSYKKTMNSKPLDQKHILLGVTGSIAAYKAADLASKLAQAGARVNTLLTQAATQFVSPLTFQSVTGQEAYTDAALWGAQAHVLHVGMGHTADLLVIAPATANTIARLAYGLGDNLLVLTALAFGPGTAERPLVIAPAMDGGMYTHLATQENLARLHARGAVIIGPEAGHLASGLKAHGRMSEPAVLVGHIRYLLTRQGALHGKQIVVTAGGTQEAIDPVRMITNRSSGKQGYALAQAALDQGAEVTLITAPTALTPPWGARLVAVSSAAEMHAAVLEACQEADALLMAAAVADFTPTRPSGQKIKKHAALPLIELTPTADILATVADIRAASGRPRIVIGFAAETQDLLTNAQSKLQAKRLDLIAANDVSAADAGFGVDSNRVILLRADGSREELPLMSKEDVAERIIQELVGLLDKP